MSNGYLEGQSLLGGAGMLQREGNTRRCLRSREGKGQLLGRHQLQRGRSGRRHGLSRVFGWMNVAGRIKQESSFDHNTRTTTLFAMVIFLKNLRRRAGVAFSTGPPLTIRYSTIKIRMLNLSLLLGLAQITESANVRVLY